MEVLHKKANEPPLPLAELRTGLPPAMVALVERAMARSPDDRPQSMADMAYEIRSIENALLTTPPPVLVPPTSTSSRDDAQGSLQAVLPELSVTRIVRPFAFRRRIYVASVAAVALLVVGAFFLLGRLARDRRDNGPGSAPAAVAPAALPAAAEPVPP